MLEPNPAPRSMSRRDFLKLSEALSLGFILSACGLELTQTKTPAASATPMPAATQAPAATPTPGCVERSSLAQVVIVEGQRYEALVPDTLDLQENAKLAINALTRCTNPDHDYEVYFYGNPTRNPPAMYRPLGFYAKFWEALALMRYLTGSSFNTQVDGRWRQIFLEMFQRDALGFSFTDARLLCWAANNSRQEKSVCWQEIAEEAVVRLSKTLTHEKDFCYYLNDSGAMRTGWEATFEGWTLQGVTRVYALTGSSSARRLADELARYLKDHAQIFDANGNFLARHESDMGPALHFHHNGNAMAALSEYALATRDLEFAAFAQKGYEYGRSVGWPLVGFFPEYIENWPDPRPYIDCETCATVDMIMMAVNLSKLDQGDYWDDVDRYVRNQFTEMQMKSGDWIDRIAANYPTTPVEAGEDGTDIAERVVGSFAGWASANDYCANKEENFISACCSGNGARAIYYVWENMLGFNNGTLSIHLLLNRASPWGDVNSYIPYEGRVDVTMKTACNVEVRIPEWVDPEGVSCFVNDTPRKPVFRGRYAQVGPVESGNLVTVVFPISERTVAATIGGVSYTLVIKGNDVVSIDPPGECQSFYQRAHYRKEVRGVKRERFVPTI